MVTLLLVRHGEAEGNREHRFIGQTDVPLTTAGHAQVERLTARLVTRRIDRVVSSDLQRCHGTVEPAARALGLDVEIEPRLREIANGEWSGRLVTEIEAGWPEMFARYRQGEDVERPGGEQWIDVSRRVTAALESLAEQSAEDEVVLIGTHAGPTLAAARWAAGIPISGNVFRGRFGGVQNTSITSIVHPGPRLTGFNDHAHLEG